MTMQGKEGIFQTHLHTSCTKDYWDPQHDNEKQRKTYFYLQRMSSLNKCQIQANIVLNKYQWLISSRIKLLEKLTATYEKQCAFNSIIFLLLRQNPCKLFFPLRVLLF